MYESLIKQVKERVNIIDVARRYGINVNNHNKALCCFHKEKTPSLSFHREKQIYKCFSCGKGGDVISLVSELFNINSYQSAIKINNDFNLGLEGKKTTYFEVNKYKQKQSLEESFKNWENQTLQLLCDYLHLLWKWKKLKDPENDLYIEAINNEDYIDYLIDDIFINGTNEDKIWFWKTEKCFIEKIKSTLKNQ